MGTPLGETLAQLDQAPTLRDLSAYELLHGQGETSDPARQRLLALETLASQCEALAAMDFTFLFDPARDLFSTGFNIIERRRDNSFYDRGFA